jgi:hypothetical protein
MRHIPEIVIVAFFLNSNISYRASQRMRPLKIITSLILSRKQGITGKLKTLITTVNLYPNRDNY